MVIFMKIINGEILSRTDISCLEQFFHANTEDFLFFDIETTGLSARNCICYLIGCVFFKDNVFLYRQYFAELPEQEKDIITQFLMFVKNFKYIVHFNGDSFDIPFLKERVRLLRINKNLDNNSEFTSLDNIPSIDLFKTVKSLSSILKLPNYRQKTVENLLGLSRDDIFSGGDLIQTYQEYLKVYLLYEKTHDEALSKDIDEKLASILLHNHDDIAALPQIASLFCCKAFLAGGFTVEKSFVSSSKPHNSGCITKQAVFVLKSDFSVPKELSYKNEIYSLSILQDNATLEVPMYTGELKYFYKNYKDYYYLPEEDTAIHKSVAFYVDKNHRIQAKASNCCSKKAGTFLPQLTETETPCFKFEYSDKTTYFLADDNFFNNTDRINNYVKALIKDLIKN